MTVAAPDIIGNSPSLLAAKERALRVARTSYPVIIYGESGTGKELFARLVHAASDRADALFVTVNCGAIPRELAESELFGHERGAFTGAVTARPGAFQRAHGGTLFLDEVGDLPVDLQVKLLRALQWGEVHPLGGDSTRKVDVRIIAATHRDLARLLAEEKFREDLYYRLAVYAITLPPLRERGPDIITIASQILRHECPGKRLTPSAQTLLLESLWPGNVRQLENVLKAATVDTRGDEIAAATLREVALFRPRRVTLPDRQAPGAGAAPERAPCGTEGAATALTSTEDSRDAVLAFIASRGSATAANIRRALRTRKATCYRLLAELESAGRIARHGSGPATRYTVVDDRTETAESHGAEIMASVADLTDRHRTIIDAFGAAPSMTVRELEAGLPRSPSRRTLRADLHRLRLLGLVRSDGCGPATRWSAVPPADRDGA